MNIEKLRPYFFLAALIGAGVLFFLVVKPFLILFALALIFSVILKPVYQYFFRHMEQWPATASLLTILLSVICLLLPAIFLGSKLVQEAQQLFISLSSGDGNAHIQSLVANVTSLVQPYIPTSGNLSASLTTFFQKYTSDLLSWLVSNIGPLFTNISNILFSFFIFFMALFYLLRDGDKLKQVVVELSPLADKDDNKVLHRLEVAVNSVVRGNLTLALLQGILSGIGMTIFGIPNPVLWGMMAGFAAFVPGLGTSIVLVPAAVFLFVTGSLWAAAGLLIWAMFAVGMIDNFLGPRLVGRGARLHPLVVLFSVLGGIVFFGPAGVFLGPLSASLFLSLLALYTEAAI